MRWWWCRSSRDQEIEGHGCLGVDDAGGVGGLHETPSLSLSLCGLLAEDFHLCATFRARPCRPLLDHGAWSVHEFALCIIAHFAPFRRLASSCPAAIITPCPLLLCLPAVAGNCLPHLQQRHEDRRKEIEGMMAIVAKADAKDRAAVDKVFAGEVVADCNSHGNHTTATDGHPHEC